MRIIKLLILTAIFILLGLSISLGAIPAACPVDSSTMEVLRSFEPDVHRGIDINAMSDSKVYAVASGNITWSGRLPNGISCVSIEHENGMRTTYLPVKLDASLECWRKTTVPIACGQEFGILETGDSSCKTDHLHLGLKSGHGDNETYHDPLGYFSFLNFESPPANILGGQASDPAAMTENPEEPGEIITTSSQAGSVITPASLQATVIQAAAPSEMIPDSVPTAADGQLPKCDEANRISTDSQDQLNSEPNTTKAHGLSLPASDNVRTTSSGTRRARIALAPQTAIIRMLKALDLMILSTGKSISPRQFENGISNNPLSGSSDVAGADLRTKQVWLLLFLALLWAGTLKLVSEQIKGLCHSITAIVFRNEMIIHLRAVRPPPMPWLLQGHSKLGLS